MATPWIFWKESAANMPRARQTKRAVPSPSPNQVSIATLVSVGPLGILLGADVENSGRPTAGWEAILGAHNLQPAGPRASLHKIAHHGSANAHNRGIWDNLLITNPLAVVTPWRKGGHRLPTDEGARIFSSYRRMPFLPHRMREVVEGGETDHRACNAFFEKTDVLGCVLW